MKIFLVVEDVSGCCGGYEPLIAAASEEAARSFCERLKKSSDDPWSRYGYYPLDVSAWPQDDRPLAFAYRDYTEWPPPPPPVYEPPPEPKPLRIYPAVLT